MEGVRESQQMMLVIGCFDKHKWMEDKVTKIWDFCKPILCGFMWSWQVGVLYWCYKLKYSFEDLWLEFSIRDALNKRHIARGMCFFCAMELKRSRHWFLSSMMARIVQSCIKFSVHVFDRSKTIFVQQRTIKMPYFLIMFEFLRYWWLWFNWICLIPLLWFASWGDKICSKVKMTSFVVIDNVR